MLVANTTLQGRYLIERLLGEGGMGAVYQAVDSRLDITVALKECFFSEEPLRKQFEREARFLAKLRHPAITKVIDHFTEGDGQFLVMEFIQGDDLHEMLERRGEPFPPAEVLKWGDQLLDALGYLHSQDPQIIHRDIKPQNLKVNSSGQIILLDFGLAKSLASQMSRVTTSASILGYTPSYAPLEQIQGIGTDHRSDLYALAATLYHLITGVTPAGALTRATTVLNNQADPLQPANEINSQVTPAVAAVLMQAMAIDRDRRPGSADKMREALREAAQSGSLVATKSDPNAATVAVNAFVTTPQQQNKTELLSSPPFQQSMAGVTPSESGPATEPTRARVPSNKAAPETRRSNKGVWIATALAALVAVIVLLAVFANRSSNSAGVSSDKSSTDKSTPANQPSVVERAASTTSGATKTLTSNNKDVKAVAFSPDGKTLASGNDDGTLNLWDTETQALKKTLGDTGPEVVSVAFAPDGESLAIARVSDGGTGSVSVLDVKTGEVKQRLVEDNINAVAFSPDGKTLAVANISSALKLWDVASGSVKQTLLGQDIQTRSVVFSPDGSMVVGGGTGNTVKVWNVQTGYLRLTLTGHDGEIGAVAFSPDGKTIASGSYDETVKLWDATTGELRRTLVGSDSVVTGVVFSPNSKTISGAVVRTVLVWDTQNGTLKQKLTGHEGLINSIAVSVDGRTLATGAADGSVKLWDVSGLK